MKHNPKLVSAQADATALLVKLVKHLETHAPFEVTEYEAEHMRDPLLHCLLLCDELAADLRRVRELKRTAN